MQVDSVSKARSLTTVAEAVKANLHAALWGLEHVEHALKADQVPDSAELAMTYTAIRAAIKNFDGVMSAAGEHMSAKLVSGLPEHRKASL